MKETLLLQRCIQHFEANHLDGDKVQGGQMIATTEVVEIITHTLKQAAEALGQHEFQMNIDEYLPKVKAWQGGYDRPFDDGYAQALTDAQKLLLGEDNENV
jgi:hypothetical protein